MDYNEKCDKFSIAFVLSSDDIFHLPYNYDTIKNDKYYVEREREVLTMALVKCPECGREGVSDSAQMCPNCGYNINLHFEKIKKQNEMMKTINQRQKINDIKQQEYEKKLSTVKRPKKPILNVIFKRYLIVYSIFVIISSVFTIYSIIENGSDNVFFDFIGFLVSWLILSALFVVVPWGICSDIYKKQLYEYQLSQQDFRAYQIYIITKKEKRNNTYTTNTYAANTSNHQVACPRCGSTNIQLVNRRWSMLTGFMTNKVDRVCVNCKQRF